MIMAITLNTTLRTPLTYVEWIIANVCHNLLSKAVALGFEPRSPALGHTIPAGMRCDLIGVWPYRTRRDYLPGRPLNCFVIEAGLPRIVNTRLCDTLSTLFSVGNSNHGSCQLHNITIFKLILGPVIQLGNESNIIVYVAQFWLYTI